MFLCLRFLVFWNIFSYKNKALLIGYKYARDYYFIPPHNTDFQLLLKISRLGLEMSEKKSKISRLGLVSVSKNHFKEVSVSSRSRKIILQKSRSRLGLEKRLIKNSRLVSCLGFS